jgi:hypothetical protein
LRARSFAAESFAAALAGLAGAFAGFAGVFAGVFAGFAGAFAGFAGVFAGALGSRSLGALRPTRSARNADGQASFTGQAAQAGARAVQMRRP